MPKHNNSQEKHELFKHKQKLKQIDKYKEAGYVRTTYREKINVFKSDIDDIIDQIIAKYRSMNLSTDLKRIRSRLRCGITRHTLGGYKLFSIAVDQNNQFALMFETFLDNNDQLQCSVDDYLMILQNIALNNTISVPEFCKLFDLIYKTKKRDVTDSIIRKSRDLIVARSNICYVSPERIDDILRLLADTHSDLLIDVIDGVSGYITNYKKETDRFVTSLLGKFNMSIITKIFEKGFQNILDIPIENVIDEINNTDLSSKSKLTTLSNILKISIKKENDVLSSISCITKYLKDDNIYRETKDIIHNALQILFDKILNVSHQHIVSYMDCILPHKDLYLSYIVISDLQACELLLHKEKYIDILRNNIKNPVFFTMLDNYKAYGNTSRVFPITNIDETTHDFIIMLLKVKMYDLIEVIFKKLDLKTKSNYEIPMIKSLIDNSKDTLFKLFFDMCPDRHYNDNIIFGAKLQYIYNFDNDKITEEIKQCLREGLVIDATMVYRHIIRPIFLNGTMNDEGFNKILDLAKSSLSLNIIFDKMIVDVIDYIVVNPGETKYLRFLKNIHTKIHFSLPNWSIFESHYKLAIVHLYCIFHDYSIISHSEVNTLFSSMITNITYYISTSALNVCIKMIRMLIEIAKIDIEKKKDNIYGIMNNLLQATVKSRYVGSFVKFAGELRELKLYPEIVEAYELCLKTSAVCWCNKTFASTYLYQEYGITISGQLTLKNLFHSLDERICCYKISPTYMHAFGSSGGPGVTRDFMNLLNDEIAKYFTDLDGHKYFSLDKLDKLEDYSDYKRIAILMMSAMVNSDVSSNHGMIRIDLHPYILYKLTGNASELNEIDRVIYINNIKNDTGDGFKILLEMDDYEMTMTKDEYCRKKIVELYEGQYTEALDQFIEGCLVVLDADIIKIANPNAIRAKICPEPKEKFLNLVLNNTNYCGSEREISVFKEIVTELSDCQLLKLIKFWNGTYHFSGKANRFGCSFHHGMNTNYAILCTAATCSSHLYVPIDSNLTNSEDSEYKQYIRNIIQYTLNNQDIAEANNIRMQRG